MNKFTLVMLTLKAEVEIKHIKNLEKLSRCFLLNLRLLTFVIKINIYKGKTIFAIRLIIVTKLKKKTICVLEHDVRRYAHRFPSI